MRAYDHGRIRNRLNKSYAITKTMVLCVAVDYEQEDLCALYTSLVVLYNKGRWYPERYIRRRIMLTQSLISKGILAY